MQQQLKQYKKQLVSLYLMLIVVVLIGTSFAIFQNFTRQSSSNNLSATNCFSITFEGVTNALNLANDYPIPDKEGLQRDPYTFKITNNCNQYLTLNIGIETLNTSEIPASLIKGVIIKNGVTPTSAIILSSGKIMESQNNGNAYVLLTDNLSAKSSKTYDLRLWFDESMTKEQGASKKYQGKVVVEASADVAPTFKDVILANNEVKTPLTTPGKEASAHTLDDIIDTTTTSVSSTYQGYYFTYGTGWEANDINFNLTGTGVTTSTYANSYNDLVGKYLVSSSPANNGSSTAGSKKTTTNLTTIYYVVSATSSSYTTKRITSSKNTTEALIASTPDDYGTSYYFRGNVKNNYVEFANKCWRIVRIVGDGSVKLVLHNDNTSKVDNPCSSSNNSADAAFAHYKGATYKSSFNSSNNDNTYIGLMYGTSSASNYATAHTNTNKSTILTNLETWYQNNLSSYESKLADIIWCNDKSTVSGGLGYGTNVTNYASYSRITSLKTPSLICQNDNNGGKLSKFTVSDTTGNGKLTYKIGMLTVDEVAFAGSMSGRFNYGTYLQENTGGTYWWTMTPTNYNGSSAFIWAISSGLLGNGGVGGSYGIRPSISLVPSVSVSGSGTIEDPYKID